MHGGGEVNWSRKWRKTNFELTADPVAEPVAGPQLPSLGQEVMTSTGILGVPGMITITFVSEIA